MFITTADKLARLNETKALLKTRLTEKGLDVSSENNFYNLADKVGEIQSGVNSIDFTGEGQTEITFSIEMNNFFIMRLVHAVSGLLYGVYGPETNMISYGTGYNTSTFDSVSISNGYTIINVGSISKQFSNNCQYRIYYW